MAEKKNSSVPDFSDTLKKFDTTLQLILARSVHFEPVFDKYSRLDDIKIFFPKHPNSSELSDPVKLKGDLAPFMSDIMLESIARFLDQSMKRVNTAAKGLGVTKDIAEQIHPVLGMIMEALEKQK